MEKYEKISVSELTKEFLAILNFIDLIRDNRGTEVFDLYTNRNMITVCSYLEAILPSNSRSARCDKSLFESAVLNIVKDKLKKM